MIGLDRRMSSYMCKVELSQLVKRRETAKCKLDKESKGVGKPILCSGLRFSLSAHSAPAGH